MRDSQRQRVYDAERKIKHPRAIKLLTQAETVALVERVMWGVCLHDAEYPKMIRAYRRNTKLSARDKAKWHDLVNAMNGNSPVFRIYFMTRRRSAQGCGKYVVFPPWAMKRWIIVHECAHALMGRSEWGKTRAAHGPEFCQLYVHLMRKFVTHSAGDELAQLFDEGGVNRFSAPIFHAHQVAARPQESSHD